MACRMGDWSRAAYDIYKVVCLYKHTFAHEHMAYAPTYGLAGIGQRVEELRKEQKARTE